MKEDIQQFLDTYYSTQSTKEKRSWNKKFLARERARKILAVLECVTDGYVPGWFKKKMNIDIDLENKLVYASLQHYSKKKSEWTLDTIKGEANKEILYALSDTISLEVDMYNRFFYLYCHDKVGVVATDGKNVLMQPLYDTLHTLPQYSYNGIIGSTPTNLLFASIQDGKKGIVDMQGKEIIACIYDDIKPLFEGSYGKAYKLIKDHKEGYVYIDEKVDGVFAIRRLIEPFADAFIFVEYADEFSVEHIGPGGYMVYQQDNKNRAEHINNKEDKIALSDVGAYDYLDYSKKITVGILDGERILRKYEGRQRSNVVETIKLGWDIDVTEIDPRNGPYLKFKKGGKYGINKRGIKNLIPAEYDDIVDSGLGSGLRFFCKKDTLRGMYAYDGDLIFPLQFDDIRYPYDEYYLYGKKNNKRKLYVPEVWLENPQHTFNLAEEFDDITIQTGIGEKWMTAVIVRKGEEYFITSKFLTTRSKAYFALQIVGGGYEKGEGQYFDIIHMVHGNSVHERAYFSDIYNAPKDELPF